ncbi:tyrosine-type recombinase/integrase [Desulfopila aestuarii]|uniref:Phage integrase family protein n=1 Tax=Desulfopila aestuarii DSM 18488 TaxID=1121416 RepID=A0A1M7YBT8_9BACT|nr:tyrosine-type recombinase/integrase [Desulfopila aestuarii]SHO50097.1 Phage integrase family protein [Desulfopila aestuarii DSM 18488]
MQNTAKIIPFNSATNVENLNKDANTKIVQYGEPVKYFRREEIQALRRIVREQGEVALLRGNVTGVREWMAVDILSTSGIRVAEIADLRCGDLQVKNGQSSIFIRCGKGRKSRNVEIPLTTKQHIKRFLKWKASRGESVQHDSHLFQGQRGPMKSQAFQLMVKKYLKLLGLYEKRKSIHSLRHSYGTQLYRQCKDIRVVQRQLGHESSRTTEIYAAILPEDVQQEIRCLWSN